MIVQVFAILSQGINAVASWFTSVVDSMSLSGLIIGIVCMAIFFRLVINPLFMGRLKSGKSDSVQTIKGSYYTSSGSSSVRYE